MVPPALREPFAGGRRTADGGRRTADGGRRTADGEMMLLDRSWYKRVGVERVMGFCRDAELEEFFRDVPEFERMLVRSGMPVVC